MIVRLKQGKELALQRKHPWIFSGAVEAFPPGCDAGQLCSVVSSSGDFLALAYFHPEHSLCGRVLSFENKPLLLIFREKIRAALLRRTPFFRSITTGYRLVNAEGDGLPGLIVDFYDGVLVIQIGTAGMERCRDLIVTTLVDEIHPKAIYEKSHGPSRKSEGLLDREGPLFGTCPDEVIFQENGLYFAISLSKGQKTGFFLDQREMRDQIRALSFGKKVLNGCAYTGGGSIAALAGGATCVDSVEISPNTQAVMEKNIALNGQNRDLHHIFTEDIFAFFQRFDRLPYDIVVLDPPAFAKKRSDFESACRGYRQLLAEVLHRAKENSLLVFSSCSYYLNEKWLETLAFQVALETKREIVIIGRHRQAFDHPISLFHPEGEYLKSIILHIA